MTLPLGTYPSMHAAYDEYTRLTTLFKTTFKRGEKVELFLGSQGDPKGAQVHSMRVSYEPENEAEAQWFAANVSNK